VHSYVRARAHDHVDARVRVHAEDDARARVNSYNCSVGDEVHSHDEEVAVEEDTNLHRHSNCEEHVHGHVPAYLDREGVDTKGGLDVYCNAAATVGVVEVVVVPEARQFPDSYSDSSWCQDC
jgi:hypothetical protein